MAKSYFDKEEDDDVVEKPKYKAISSIKGEERASGYCGVCHERYFDVIVIDGVPQCPNCSK